MAEKFTSKFAIFHFFTDIENLLNKSKGLDPDFASGAQDGRRCQLKLVGH